MTTRFEKRLQVREAARLATTRSADTSRRRCFVSYHIEDTDEVVQFLSDYGDEFIPTVVGVTEDDDFVDSDDMDYVMRRIREEHLGNTTITIVLVGACTSKRKFIDWEVYATLKAYNDYRPSGLLAINLPYMGKTGGLPDRVNDNITTGYASYMVYPSLGFDLRAWIDEAFERRTNSTHLIDNTRSRRRQNSPC